DLVGHKASAFYTSCDGGVDPYAIVNAVPTELISHRLHSYPQSRLRAYQEPGQETGSEERAINHERHKVCPSQPCHEPGYRQERSEERQNCGQGCVGLEARVGRSVELNAAKDACSECRRDRQ